MDNSFFQNIIDVIGIASFIIWKNLYPTWNQTKNNSQRKIFIREIVLYLVKPHVHRRGNEGLTKYHIEAIKDVAGTSKQQDTSQLTEEFVIKRKKRCHICPSKISRTSKQCCDKCNLNVCSEHSIKKILCRNCI